MSAFLLITLLVSAMLGRRRFCFSFLFDVAGH